MFPGEARSFHYSEASDRRFTRVGSSLLIKGGTYGRKKFYNIGPSLMSKKLPSLKWKTWPKQLLGSHPLALALSRAQCYKNLMSVIY